MTAARADLPAPPLSIFSDDEPVIQSHPLLPGAAPPRFGVTDRWDLNAVIRRPANKTPSAWRIRFAGLPGEWNLLARELAMIWLNPRHPGVLQHGLHLAPRPASPPTVLDRVRLLHRLASWCTAEQLPSDLRGWEPETAHRYLDHLREQGVSEQSIVHHITVIKELHRLGPALAINVLSADPWPGVPASGVVTLAATGELTTPTIDPQIWFPLVKAAWTYIDSLGPDILRGHTLWRTLRATARYIHPSRRAELVEQWLACPDNLVPLRPTPHWNSSTLVNWELLSYMLGADPTRVQLFRATKSTSRRWRTMVQDAVAHGRTQPGLVADLRTVERLDGSHGPWHDCLTPRALWLECLALRNACYVLVAALSMMRDSEIREITKDALVQHYGSPAVVSRKRKLDPDLPNERWWITEPVRLAITTASALSQHDELAFGRVGNGRSPEEMFDSGDAVVNFIAHVNRHRHVTGLPAIPEGRVTPHMFRRTMAMLTRDYPGSEIALGMQLKHMATRALANRHTQGYAAPTPAWAKHFDAAQQAGRIQKLRDLYDAHQRGEPIGYGPAAERLTASFDAIARAATEMRDSGQARHGDARVEYDLLRKAGISLRFGKLNHCAMNDADSAGAKCLENVTAPDGHRGPLIDRCQPGRCANSVIAPEHLPIWRTEQHSLLTLLDTPMIAPGRRAQLRQQLDDVRAVIRKAKP
jgi:integrase